MAEYRIRVLKATSKDKVWLERHRMRSVGSVIAQQEGDWSEVIS